MNKKYKCKCIILFNNYFQIIWNKYCQNIKFCFRKYFYNIFVPHGKWFAWGERETEVTVTMTSFVCSPALFFWESAIAVWKNNYFCFLRKSCAVACRHRNMNRHSVIWCLIIYFIPGEKKYSVFSSNVWMHRKYWFKYYEKSSVLQISAPTLFQVSH